MEGFSNCLPRHTLVRRQEISLCRESCKFFSFPNCQNFSFPTVKIFIFKLSKFSISNCQNFRIPNCQNFPFPSVKIFLFKLSKFFFLKLYEKNCLMCREIPDFGLVCRDSKCLGNTGLMEQSQ
jgi:hypothetical protein